MDVAVASETHQEDYRQVSRTSNWRRETGQSIRLSRWAYIFVIGGVNVDGKKIRNVEYGEYAMCCRQRRQRRWRRRRRRRLRQQQQQQRIILRRMRAATRTDGSLHRRVQSAESALYLTCVLSYLPPPSFPYRKKRRTRLIDAENATKANRRKRT